MSVLFKRELKSGYKGLLIWTISTCLLVITSMWEYSATANEQSFDELFSTFPDIVNVLFGVTSLGMGDIIGYFALIMYYVYFIGVAYAFVLGNNILQKEIDDKTAEFLFTKPITRQNILKSKMAVVGVDFVVFNLVAFISSALVMVNVGDTVYDNNQIVNILASSYFGLLLLMVLVFLITLTLNIVMKKRVIASAISGVIILYMYAMSIATQAFDGLSGLDFLTPWRYFAIDNIVNNYGYKLIYVIITIAVIVGLRFLALKKIEDKTF